MDILVCGTGAQDLSAYLTDINYVNKIRWADTGPVCVPYGAVQAGYERKAMQL
jgi:hypothetical protein